jgi:hypothetical protein
MVSCLLERSWLLLRCRQVLVVGNDGSEVNMRKFDFVTMGVDYGFVFGIGDTRDSVACSTNHSFGRLLFSVNLGREFFLSPESISSTIDLTKECVDSMM